MENKIFDEQYVDCNDCGAYWNDQCDGLPMDRVKHCNSYYKATRNIDIPNKINELENEIKVAKIRDVLYFIAIMVWIGVIHYV